MSTIAMNLTTIDTLAFSKRMQKAGLEQRTADELAEAINEAHSQSINSFATKSDLENKINLYGSKLEQKIDLVRKEIELSKQEVIIRTGRSIYVATALIITVISISVAFLKF